jgi:hypothetical protein
MNSTFGLFSIAIAIISYSIYFKDIFYGRTKPHGFTWLIWAILNALIFYQQLINGAGAGAWVTGLAAVIDGTVFITSFRYGSRNINYFDWLCLLLASISIVLWLYSIDPQLSVIIASFTFAIGFIPTIRKSLRHPGQETILTFGLNGIKFLVALFALSSITITTALYPFVLFVLNISFALFLLFHKAPSKKIKVKQK